MLSLTSVRRPNQWSGLRNLKSKGKTDVSVDCREVFVKGLGPSHYTISRNPIRELLQTQSRRTLGVRRRRFKALPIIHPVNHNALWSVPDAWSFSFNLVVFSSFIARAHRLVLVLFKYPKGSCIHNYDRVLWFGSQLCYNLVRREVAVTNRMQQGTTKLITWEVRLQFSFWCKEPTQTHPPPPPPEHSTSKLWIMWVSLLLGVYGWQIQSNLQSSKSIHPIHPIHPTHPTHNNNSPTLRNNALTRTHLKKNQNGLLGEDSSILVMH